MSISPFVRWASAPEAEGLYDPAFDKDACGLAMVATLRGTPGHDIVQKALAALRNLEHRGAVGSDAGTGDGAGIITQIPDGFLRDVVDFELPTKGCYAVGIAFLPSDPSERSAEQSGIEAIAREEQLHVLGWREVPHNPEVIGDTARETMPAFWQLFVRSTATTEKGRISPGLISTG
jgi:glutamate synthase (NADPH/NADH) large chain